ncbi:MAG: NADH-quinone oxidoreductase subunit H [Candidatus Eremiobacteraeota bacterium]|nr:NADH-quinone oxidoreductase subunit H [Candidatus Eremiobacteraeota bacterium]
MFIIFFIGSVAETNRAPFDLAEAESELVSGFMTEHAAVIFVFFFLAEYASILLICILTSLLFLGGYLLDTTALVNINYLFINKDVSFTEDLISSDTSENILHFLEIQYLNYYEDLINSSINDSIMHNPIVEGMMFGLILGIKSCIMVFTFI